MRAKYIETQIAARESDTTSNLQRQRKAASVSGGGGSIPRSDPAPNLANESERRAAMVSHIGAAMGRQDN